MTFRASKNPRIALDLEGNAEITLTADRSVLAVLETLKDKDLSVEIKPWAQKRTITQNAYFWALLGELSRKLGIRKEDAYRHYIRDYGKYEPIVLKDEAVGRFAASWGRQGLGWISERIRASKTDGYAVVLAYYGSSAYDSAEMSAILEPLIQDCNEQGIATCTLQEALEMRNEND